ncbi:MAG: hypothetical protein JWM90_380, partial [Thermoleophilia bacterium]|nr:hypothetical protein [Thermoleophilia bacterium]
AATGEAPADGTVVAGAGAGAPAAGPNAASSGSSGGGSGGGGGASASSIEIAQETEKAMNVGLPEGRLTPELGEPVATSDAVASTGAKLEKLAEAYSDCLRSAKDYYDCLDELKGAKTERIYDSKPYGALVSMKTSGGTVVRLSIRGDALCRMFKPGTTCDAWSSVG